MHAAVTRDDVIAAAAAARDLAAAGRRAFLRRLETLVAVDTGLDYIYTNGTTTGWLPTGSNFSPSAQPGFYGTPTIHENWTWHEDPATNADSLAHFAFLCEYG